MVSDRILDIARSWIGTPYKRARLAKGQGADCLNFAGGVYLEAGIISSVPVEGYRSQWWTDPHADLITSAIERAHELLQPGFSIRTMPPGDVRPGDLCGLACLTGDRRVTHVAFLESLRAGSFNILHAREGVGGRVECVRKPPTWRIATAWRVEHE